MHHAADWIAMPLPFEESTPDLLAAFRLHGLASGHSPRTRTAREATILRLSEGADLLTVTREDLIEWLASLDIAKSSRATYRAHLRVWFGWLAETGRRDDNPAASLPAVRAPRGVPRPISPADVARTSTGVVAGPKSFHGGFYVSDDGTVFGQKVDVKVDPLYDATYGYSYDPPMGTATWDDADMTAGQKTMLSQRGITTTYKRWGV